MLKKRTYRKITSFFLKRALPRDFKEENLTFTAYDIDLAQPEYVTFKVREAPGWLFGIWYNNHVFDNGKVTYRFHLFAQFAEEIDKFKPSRSPLCCSLHVGDAKDLNLPYRGAIVDMIKFIITEPALAYCRDVHYWDYNTEYHSREEAMEVMHQDACARELRRHYQETCDKCIFNYILNFFPADKSERYGFIRDHGDLVWPRYELVFFSDVNDSCTVDSLTEDKHKEILDFVKGYVNLCDECVKNCPKSICYDDQWSRWVEFITPEKLNDPNYCYDSNYEQYLF